jgi:uncharacterized protein with NAD-binding domain and iron-sulfur cluster
MESTLEFQLPNGRLARYAKSHFPNPLHQILTIGRFEGLPWSSRWKLLSWLEQIWEGSMELDTDLEHRTAEDWMESLGHDRSVVQTIWNPLASWLTGNDLRGLSADAFVAALKPFFLSHSADNRIYLPRHQWHQTFIQPLANALNSQGTTLLPEACATRLDYENDRITGVRLQDGRLLQADWYVLALPHQRVTPLLPERWLTRYAYFQQITELTTISWTTVEVRAPQSMTSARHILIGSGPISWVTCRPSESGRGTVATLFMPSDQASHKLDQQAPAVLQSFNLLDPSSRFTVTAQPARIHQVLALPPGTKTRRPIQRSPIENLLLAGAWTDTGWPANLESAIVSGERCAEIIASHSAA